MPQLKPCVICGKLLKPIFDNWDTMQPDDGGEIQLIFAYGSSKLDCTTAKGVICDDCGEDLITRMDDVCSSFN